MHIEAILRGLRSDTGTYPRGPVKAAIAQQEKITPHLLRIVERATENVDSLTEDEEYDGYIFAFYLLAQFREERAYALIVDFFSTPGDVTLDATGDVVTEDLQRMLASVSGGDMGPMVSMAKNASLNEYVRSAALGAMVCLFVEGVRSREEVIGVFRDLYRGGLERERSYVWAALISETSYLHAQSLLEDIRQAFADGLIDESAIDLDYVETHLAMHEAAALARLRERGHYRFIDDVIAATRWWAGHEPPPDDVGRNDPCPCGSGMKFKRCCGNPRL